MSILCHPLFPCSHGLPRSFSIVRSCQHDCLIGSPTSEPHTAPIQTPPSIMRLFASVCRSLLYGLPQCHHTAFLKRAQSPEALKALSPITRYAYLVPYRTTTGILRYSTVQDMHCTSVHTPPFLFASNNLIDIPRTLRCAY